MVVGDDCVVGFLLSTLAIEVSAEIIAMYVALLVSDPSMAGWSSGGSQPTGFEGLPTQAIEAFLPGQCAYNTADMFAALETCQTVLRVTAY